MSTTRHLSMTLAGCLLGVAAILLIHRYPGVNHDSSLYLGQALYRRWPAIFGQDLFFLYGSQDSYTLMPWMVSKSLALFSAPTVFLAGTLASLLLFAAGCWYFLGAVLPERQRYWGWLAALCLPATYGVVSIFSYGEPFLTSRAPAEGFCLLALGLLVRRKWRLAGACLLVAGLLHPLQAIGAILVVWPWLILQDRRWLHLAWLALPVALLGLTDVRPLNDLYRQMDAAWLTNVSGFTRQLFLAGWRSADWTNLAFDVLILAYLAWAQAGAMRNWCIAALAGLCAGLLANAILVDWLHLALPTGLQLWRAHWLAHLLANAAIGALLYRDAINRDWARLLCLSLLVLLVEANTAWWVWMAFAALYAGWPSLLRRSTPLVRGLLGTLFACGTLVILAVYLSSELLQFRMAHYRLELYAFDRRMLAFPLLALGTPLLGTWIWWTQPRYRWPIMVLLAGALAIGAYRWDARSPIALAVEHNQNRPDLFGPTLPTDAQVFWVGDIYAAPWITLRRAEYFNTRQLAGVAFNQGTAIEGRARMERVRPVIEEHMYCQDRAVPLREREHCRISDASLRRACAPGDPRAPDYLVLPYLQAQPAEGSWAIMDPKTGQPAVTYWLYDCHQVIRNLDASTQ